MIPNSNPILARLAVLQTSHILASAVLFIYVKPNLPHWGNALFSVGTALVVALISSLLVWASAAADAELSWARFFFRTLAWTSSAGLAIALLVVHPEIADAYLAGLLMAAIGSITPEFGRRLRLLLAKIRMEPVGPVARYPGAHVPELHIPEQRPYVLDGARR